MPLFIPLVFIVTVSTIAVITVNLEAALSLTIGFYSILIGNNTLEKELVLFLAHLSCIDHG